MRKRGRGGIKVERRTEGGDFAGADEEGLRNIKSGRGFAGEALASATDRPANKQPETEVASALRNVQTTCSGSFWCTVVCTLVRQCMEEPPREDMGPHENLHAFRAEGNSEFASLSCFSSEMCKRETYDMTVHPAGLRLCVGTQCSSCSVYSKKSLCACNSVCVCVCKFLSKI
uniref:Uncharacterized protein n=1 Tax=Cynoglossus semilaevis TaxID=244447 RepID=A0A3P8V265_CYNSE